MTALSIPTRPARGQHHHPTYHHLLVARPTTRPFSREGVLGSGRLSKATLVGSVSITYLSPTPTPERHGPHTRRKPGGPRPNAWVTGPVGGGTRTQGRRRPQDDSQVRCPATRPILPLSSPNNLCNALLCYAYHIPPPRPYLGCWNTDVPVPNTTSTRGLGGLQGARSVWGERVGGGVG